MIPLSLTVRNFLSYGDTAETLAFDGLHLFCLAGENGHGKSALLDALTWCLWGQSRAGTQDELVHVGAAEMSVVFDFLLDGAQYQVLRSRRLRRGPAVTVLELRVERDGEFVPLTGSSVDETEAAIVALLGMAYRTFVNSAFLLQGRADEFTKRPPGERKQILADILNLQEYEQYERTSRERRRDADATVAELTRQIEALDRGLADAPRLEEQARDAEQQVHVVTERYDAAAAEEHDLRARREALRSQERRLAESRDEQAQARASLADVERKIQERQRDLAKAAEALHDADVRRAGYEQWQQASAALERESEKLRLLQPLREQEATAQRELDRYRDQLDHRLHEARRSLQAEQQARERGREAEEALRAVQHELRVAEQAQLDRDAAISAQQKANEQIASFGATEKQLSARLAELRSHYRLLQSAAAACPVCRSPLDRASTQRLYDDMKGEADRLKVQTTTSSQQVALLQRQRQEQETTINRLSQELLRLPALQRKVGTLLGQVESGHAAATRCAEIERTIAEIESELTADRYLADHRNARERARLEMTRVGYDPAVHARLAAQVTQLAPFQSAISDLERARQEQRDATGAIETLTLWQTQRQEALREIERRLQDLLAAVADVAAVDQALTLQQQRVAEFRNEQVRAGEALGQARTRLAQIDAWRVERTDRAAELVSAQDHLAVFGELVTAFGRNGVQAMIMEEAIPAIQDEANRLLEHMSDHQMTVALETQRMGKRGDVMETLDIRIADHVGVRRYELFSGGEAFRVNLALRVALSRYLAHRAGTRLQTLVIDEGFGSQDGKGRERLVEVLTSIQDDFETIMVITHVDELKEAFPQRVDIVKDERGSHIVMSARG